MEFVARLPLQLAVSPASGLPLPEATVQVTSIYLGTYPGLGKLLFLYSARHWLPVEDWAAPPREECSGSCGALVD